MDQGSNHRFIGIIQLDSNLYLECKGDQRLVLSGIKWLKKFEFLHMLTSQWNLFKSHHTSTMTLPITDQKSALI